MDPCLSFCYQGGCDVGGGTAVAPTNQQQRYVVGNIKHNLASESRHGGGSGSWGWNGGSAPVVGPLVGHGLASKSGSAVGPGGVSWVSRQAVESASLAPPGCLRSAVGQFCGHNFASSSAFGPGGFSRASVPPHSPIQASGSWAGASRFTEVHASAPAPAWLQPHTRTSIIIPSSRQYPIFTVPIVSVNSESAGGLTPAPPSAYAPPREIHVACVADVQRRWEAAGRMELCYSASSPPRLGFRV